jgi:two-component system, cell cycle sensor histidine kinase and response regulator CckA
MVQSVERRVGEIRRSLKNTGMDVSNLCRTYRENMLKKRILFIDDEYLLREVVYEMLTEMDYEVTVEETGTEGVRAFTEHPGEFDLVLTDLMMDDMSGDEIAERVKSIRPDLPVVVMTGTPQNLPHDRARAVGVCKVLPKPLTKLELSEGIQRALSHTC